VPRHPPNALIALDTKTPALQKRMLGSHHAQEPSHPHQTLKFDYRSTLLPLHSKPHFTQHIIQRL
jgi:hypothetical protein